MPFSSVIGQTQTKQHLVELVRLNRLSHALLLLGQEGSGALAMALAFAQYIVCEKVNGRDQTAPGASLFGDEPATPDARTQLSDACGSCPSCVKAAALIHPDIHYSYPVIPK